MTLSRSAALLVLGTLSVLAVSASPRPYPGEVRGIQADWETSLPLSDAAAGFSFGLSALGIGPEPFRFGGRIGAGFRAEGDGGPSGTARAVASAGWDFPVGGPFGLEPSFEAGAAWTFGTDGFAVSADAALALRASLRLAASDSLFLSAALGIDPLRPVGGAESIRFSLGVGIARVVRRLLPYPRMDARWTVSPARFSPDGDGEADSVEAELATAAPGSVAAWSLEVRDEAGGIFRTFRGEGAPPGRLSWDGFSDDGELALSAGSYSLTLSLRDRIGREEILRAETVVDVLVTRVGDTYRIRLPPIAFLPNSGALDWTEGGEAAEGNSFVIGRLAAILGRFPEYRIVIEGHANAVSWADPEAFMAEQRDELVPLSLGRAVAVKDALVAAGIAAERMGTVGRGASAPLVPFGDETERWKNRRVELILAK